VVDFTFNHSSNLVKSQKDGAADFGLSRLINLMTQPIARRLSPRIAACIGAVPGVCLF
jgi:hypothetical protein